MQAGDVCTSFLLVLIRSGWVLQPQPLMELQPLSSQLSAVAINWLSAQPLHAVVWHMPHGITLHLALKNSNSYYLLWSCSTNLPASITARPNCNYCSSQHHHVPSSRPSFTQFLALLLPSLMLRASTKSICCNSHLMKTPAFSYLASHLET